MSTVKSSNFLSAGVTTGLGQHKLVRVIPRDLTLKNDCGLRLLDIPRRLISATFCVPLRLPSTQRSGSLSVKVNAAAMLVTDDLMKTKRVAKCSCRYWFESGRLCFGWLMARSPAAEAQRAFPTRQYRAISLIYVWPGCYW